MSKKLSFEEVEKLFDDKGYILLETEYVNAHTKMKYICSKHKDKGVQEITANSIRSGKGCRYCGFERIADLYRLSLDDVKSIFEERGYELLEDEYVNNHTPMKYICPKHRDKGIQKITIANLKKGQGCRYCGIEKNSNNRRLKFDDVKKLFEDRGYELLETEYVSCSTKMKYICHKHKNKGVQEITIDNLKQGSGCKYCGNEKRIEKQKLPFSMVKELFEKNNLELLETEYINNSTPMKCICKKHRDMGVQTITYAQVRNGGGCKYCAKERNADRQKLPFEFVKNEFEKRGYELLETEYVNSHTLMKYVCKKHKDKGVQTIRFSNLRNGSGCKYCGFEKTLKSTRFSFDFVEAEFRKRGYKLLESQYINAHTKMKYICLKHPNYIQEITFNNLYYRHQGCKYCAGSNGEAKIRSLLEYCCVDFIEQYTFSNCKDRGLLRFDFYIPSKNICIEYDGEQHYRPIDFGGNGDVDTQENFKKTQKHDEIKTQYCIDHNIHLVRIPYWDFDNIEKILKKELNIT